jgi:hypothetical protein
MDENSGAGQDASRANASYTAVVRDAKLEMQSKQTVPALIGSCGIAIQDCLILPFVQYYSAYIARQQWIQFAERP